MVQKRQTAQKVWISMLHNGRYVKQMGEYEPNYVEYNGKEIGRINIIATIIGKYTTEDKGYVAFTIDDGSASIRIKAWKEDALAIEGHKAGELIQVIGKPREYNEETYISPELITRLTDPNFELVRKLELFKEHGIVRLGAKQSLSASGIAQQRPTISMMTDGSSSLEEEKIGEERITTGIEERAPMKEEKTLPEPAESNRQKILTLIEKLAGDDGAPIDILMKESGLTEEEVEAITQELLKEGEIYQNRPGRLSILG